MLRRILNHGEERVREQIVPATTRYDAHVYPKVRIADTIVLEGLEQALKKYALMAHFDFLVADDGHRPRFAVEFDGPGHSVENDAKKDQICRQVDLALFRVNLRMSRSKIGDLTFLNYLVHLWFLALRFKEMQSAGDLPPDEAFMISGFLRPDAKHVSTASSTC
jgi:hypothetical protein